MFKMEGFSNLLEKTGFLGAQHDRPEELDRFKESNIKKKCEVAYLKAITPTTNTFAGISRRGSRRVIFAATATDAPVDCTPICDAIDIEEDRNVAAILDYSEKYSQFDLPNPQSRSIGEKDAWDALVRSNSDVISNVQGTEYIEKALAARKTVQIQIQTLKKELKELKSHQNELKVSIAKNKAFESIHQNRRGVDKSGRDTKIRREERCRDEEKFSRHGVQFAAISGSGEYMDTDEEGGKKKRFVAPTDILIEENPQQLFVTYEQLLEYQRKQQECSDVFIDLQLNVGKQRRSHQQRSEYSIQRRQEKRKQWRKSRKEKDSNIS
jgi:hypothetical protein